MSEHDKSLLIIAHTPSKNTSKMSAAILDGAQNDVIEEVNAQLVSPLDCDSEMALNSDGIILFTTENFGYMSGALKDFFSV
jgi:multimeric flavodoxin WrbA